jgi:hypothetical protein
MQKSDAGSRTAAVQLRSGNAVLFTPMTWNPVDKDAAITLSNGNLTATASGTSAVRANGGQSGGKFYWEITATTFLNSASFVGLATAAAVFANSYSQTGVSGITRSGLLYVDNSALTTLGASNSGTVICFAVDLTAKLIWIRYGAAGQWNGSGTANPTTGTGGYSTGAIGGGTAAYPYFSENGVGDAVIANFGASAFVGAVPSGFTSGFGVTTTGTTVQSTPPLTLTTSGWQWAYRTDLNDPATGAAWTPVGVNNCVIGPVVTS